MIEFSERAREYLDRKSQTEPNTGCILWDGCTGPGGYGTAVLSGQAYKAHRLSWLAEHGPIPAGMKVCHRCDTPACINPSHLFLGTQADNVADMVSKGRNRSPKRYGASNPMAALTDDDVWNIRHIATWNRWSQAEIARSYGVSPMTISRIITGQSWPHVKIHANPNGERHVA